MSVKLAVLWTAVGVACLLTLFAAAVLINRSVARAGNLTPQPSTSAKLPTTQPTPSTKSLASPAIASEKIYYNGSYYTQAELEDLRTQSRWADAKRMLRASAPVGAPTTSTPDETRDQAWRLLHLDDDALAQYEVDRLTASLRRLDLKYPENAVGIVKIVETLQEETEREGFRAKRYHIVARLEGCSDEEPNRWKSFVDLAQDVMWSINAGKMKW